MKHLSSQLPFTKNHLPQEPPPPRATPTGATSTENHSTRTAGWAMIDGMFRHAFVLAASAPVADAPKAALLIVAAAPDGARS
ncbi:hypothetical protein FPZ41_28845 [Streptomyces sp. K1PN6]|uniref:Uncharacterized protein n=1 Tax=Streptomyces acidicola TaxID=2596892 RepID=A0A5N8WZ63_9ACTN|nr:hypothetical protein [Streptomyces acidicola]